MMMKTKIATNKEQGARLLQCGVPAESADMIGVEPDYGYECEPWSSMQGQDARGYFPAWSLSALLTKVLPKHLDDFPFTKWIVPFSDGEICEIEDNDERVLNGDVKLSCDGTAWIVDYDWDGFTGVLPNSDNPIEACVRAVELLYANGYKFNEI